MWGIAIRSSIITLLAFVAYSLLLHMLSLHGDLVANCGYVVFALGIYSAQYYYKAAHQQRMTYREGIKVGSLSVLFTALWICLITYSTALYYDGQQAYSQTFLAQHLSTALKHLKNPQAIISVIFFPIFLLGLFLTLFITIFSKTKNKDKFTKKDSHTS